MSPHSSSLALDMLAASQSVSRDRLALGFTTGAGFLSSGLDATVQLPPHCHSLGFGAELPRTASVTCGPHPARHSGCASEHGLGSSSGLPVPWILMGTPSGSRTLGSHTCLGALTGLSLTQHNSFWVGDVVRVIDDLDAVKRLQAGHGEWTDDMAPVSPSPPHLPHPPGRPTFDPTVSPLGPGPCRESGEAFRRREPVCGSRWSAVDLQPLLPGGLPARGRQQPGRG